MSLLIEYAVYRGEDCIFIGSAYSAARQLGISRKSIQWYATPSGKKRLEKSKSDRGGLRVVKL